MSNLGALLEDTTAFMKGHSKGCRLIGHFSAATRPRHVKYLQKQQAPTLRESLLAATKERGEFADNILHN